MGLTEHDKRVLREMMVADAKASIELLERWLGATEGERQSMIKAGRHMSLKMASSIPMKDPDTKVDEEIG